MTAFLSMETYDHTQNLNDFVSFWKAKKERKKALLPFSHIEMSALAPQALGSFKASSWVMLRLLNMPGLLKTLQRHLVSSETICLSGKQHAAGAFSGAFKNGWQGISFCTHCIEAPLPPPVPSWSDNPLSFRPCEKPTKPSKEKMITNRKEKKRFEIEAMVLVLVFLEEGCCCWWLVALCEREIKQRVDRGTRRESLGLVGSMEWFGLCGAILYIYNESMQLDSR